MIFYFSGTGNTRWAAEQVAAKTGERLLFIPDELKGEARYALAEGERIGFCFPVHGWQPPRIVRCFVRKIQLVPNGTHYCYALCTCGDSIGRTMEILDKELAPKGLRLNSTFSLVMPESYVCLPFMYTDSEERERQKIETASAELASYAQMIEQRKAGERHTTRGIMPWAMSHIVGGYFNGRMVTDRKFTVDAGLCVKCGRCANVCPTGDIRLKEGMPEWQHDGSCTCCLSCYHHCPRHAINYGSITRRRGQYYFGHRKPTAEKE